MILGKVIDGRVVIPVGFFLGNGMDFSIDFIVDTGFNNYLTLPPQAIAAMSLPQKC
jgi:predicted aspartyl protease